MICVHSTQPASPIIDPSAKVVNQNVQLAKGCGLHFVGVHKELLKGGDSVNFQGTPITAGMHTHACQTWQM